MTNERPGWVSSSERIQVQATLVLKTTLREHISYIGPIFIENEDLFRDLNHSLEVLDQLERLIPQDAKEKVAKVIATWFCSDNKFVQDNPELMINREALEQSNFQIPVGY